MSAFTHPASKGLAPYWIREDDIAAQAEHLRLLRKAGLIQSLNPPAQQGPNPMARSWHDLAPRGTPP